VGHWQQGEATETLAACRQGLMCSLTQPQRAALEHMETVVTRFARP
jgi:hypothetical protein